MDIFEPIQDRFQELVRENSLLDGHADVRIKTLTSQEAIGNPEHRDYRWSETKNLWRTDLMSRNL